MSAQKLSVPDNTIELVVLHCTVSRTPDNVSYGWWLTIPNKTNGSYFQLIDVAVNLMDKTVRAYAIR